MTSNNTTQSIKERVLSFIQAEGLNKNKFYIRTGIANGTLDKKSGITGDTLTKIYSAFPTIDIEWLVTGEGNMYKSRFTLSENISESKEKYASRANINPEDIIESSTIKNINNLEFVPIFAYQDKHHVEGYLSIPNLNICDGAGYVKSDSMYPLIKPGDIVCYKVSEESDEIYWGEMYIIYLLINKEAFLTTKYINKSELGDDYVKLDSHNEKYTPKDVLKENIAWKAIIKASIRYNSII